MFSTGLKEIHWQAVIRQFMNGRNAGLLIALSFMGVDRVLIEVKLNYLSISCFVRLIADNVIGEYNMKRVISSRA